MTYNITVEIIENGQSFVDDLQLDATSKEDAVKKYDLSGDGGTILEVFEVVNTPQILAVV
jgi:hypothetical protein